MSIIIWHSLLQTPIPEPTQLSRDMEILVTYFGGSGKASHLPSLNTGGSYSFSDLWVFRFLVTLLKWTWISQFKQTFDVSGVKVLCCSTTFLSFYLSVRQWKSSFVVYLLVWCTWRWVLDACLAALNTRAHTRASSSFLLVIYQYQRLHNTFLQHEAVMEIFRRCWVYKANKSSYLFFHTIAVILRVSIL